MPRLFALLALVAGCAPPPATPPAPAARPDVPEPATFAAWPSVTPKPVPVGANAWLLCRAPTPEQLAGLKPHGPHAEHSIVVRVSPEGIDAFRAGKPLPVGAAVVKEKHGDGAMRAYAVMLKRAPGFDPAGGDWEYAFAEPAERRETRGRLVECTQCHGAAKGTDYLFRKYGE